MIIELCGRKFKHSKSGRFDRNRT